MKVISTVKEMQEFSCELRRKGKRIGVVPTMGYLHNGHLSLIDVIKPHSDIIIVTIFVNPTQFAPNEDLEKYPRNLVRDKKLCEDRNVDVVFIPNETEMYSLNNSTWVTEESLSQTLCGKSRPTHFKGVTTIVTKLFNITLPDVAVFGQKDYQQVSIIKKMVKDLNFPIKIVIAPIIREEDGLAMSSRNKYLNREGRKDAVSIFNALNFAKSAINKEQSNIKEIIKEISLRITQTNGVVDYIEILNPKTLKPASKKDSDIIIAIAAKFGNTRLIDNMYISNP